MNANELFFRCVREFLTVHLPLHQCKSDKTIKSYRDALNLLRYFMKQKKKIPFTKLSFDDFSMKVILEFLDWLEDERKCGISTRNQRLAALNSFFKYSAEAEPSLVSIYLDIRKIPIKKGQKRKVNSLSKNALQEILLQPDLNKKTGIRNQCFMITLYDTGGRIQEVLDLQIKDLVLNIESPYVYINGKGNKVRMVPLMPKTVEHLKKYISIFHDVNTNIRDNYLFYTTIKGRRDKMSQENVAKFLNKYCQMAHKECAEVPSKIHAHLFRHTKAMDLYRSGIPISYIKDFLGHESLDTTSIYAEADLEMMRSALEKVNENGVSTTKPIWENNEDMILKLCGLK